MRGFRSHSSHPVPEALMKATHQLRRCSSASDTSGIPIPDLNIELSRPPSPSIYHHSLPVIDPRVPLASISADTLASIISKSSDILFESVKVIDCRFPYEFNGGHIIGAFNLTKYSELQSLISQNSGKRTCFVFHCELSKTRSPRWMSLFRELDRIESMRRFSDISFPDIFLLHGGYRMFYKSYPNLCAGGYVSIDDDLTPGKRLYKTYSTEFLHETDESCYSSAGSDGGIRRSRASSSFYNDAISPISLSQPI